MRAALPIFIAALFCSSCVVFTLGADDTSRVFGTPDSWSVQRVLGYTVLVLQPWVLLASFFRDHWFSVLICIECAAAILVACFLLWLRGWRALYRVTAVLVSALSFLLLFYGLRMHFAAIRADQQYEETVGRDLQ
jgi:hypothetical protein